jgi:hypothetical protein
VVAGVEVEMDRRSRIVQGVRVHGAALGRSPAWSRAVRAVLGPALDDVRQHLSRDAIDQLRAWAVALADDQAGPADGTSAALGSVVGLDCALLPADALAPLQPVVDGGWPQDGDQHGPGPAVAWVVTSPFLARPGGGPSRWTFPVSAALAHAVGVRNVGVAEVTATGDLWVHLRRHPGPAHPCRAVVLEPAERVGVRIRQPGLWSYRWPRLLGDDDVGLVLSLLLEVATPRRKFSLSAMRIAL